MPATPSGVLARTATIAAMSSLALVATAAAAGAADATASAMDSSSPVGYAVFGIPVATTVWLLAGVLAVLVGLIGAARSSRSALGAPGRLLGASVDDAAFGVAEKTVFAPADGQGGDIAGQNRLQIQTGSLSLDSELTHMAGIENCRMVSGLHQIFSYLTD